MTPAALVRALLPILLAAPAAGGTMPPVAPDEPASGCRLAGVLARLDVFGRCLVVRPDSPPPRERVACLDARTELRADGQSVRFEDLRPGGRVRVDCRGAEAPCAAERVHVLGERPALDAEAP